LLDYSDYTRFFRPH